MGISLGNRTTGIAVVHNKELLEYRTLTARGGKEDTRGAVAVHYIRQYKIPTVVLKVPPASHLTEQLKAILRSLLKLVEYHGCMVRHTDTESIKRAVPGIANKRDLIAFAAGNYAELLPLQDKELSNGKKYHEKMFEAVVIAHLHAAFENGP